MKSFFTWGACTLMVLSCGQAKDVAKNDMAAWLDAALAGKKAPLPAETSPLQASDVKAAQTELWKAYTNAAKRAGWDKQLLPVPETFEKMTEGGKKPQLKSSKLKSGEFDMPYLFMAKGEKPAAGWPMFI